MQAAIHADIPRADIDIAPSSRVGARTYHGTVTLALPESYSGTGGLLSLRSCSAADRRYTHQRPSPHWQTQAVQRHVAGAIVAELHSITATHPPVAAGRVRSVVRGVDVVRVDVAAE